MAEHSGKSASGECVYILAQVLFGVRFGKPLHVVFHEYLYNITVNAFAAFESFPNAPAGGHVRAELHGGHYTPRREWRHRLFAGPCCAVQPRMVGFTGSFNLAPATDFSFEATTSGRLK
jgi:hypothetical protein